MADRCEQAVLELAADRSIQKVQNLFKQLKNFAGHLEGRGCHGKIPGKVDLLNQVRLFHVVQLLDIHSEGGLQELKTHVEVGP